MRMVQPEAALFHVQAELIALRSAEPYHPQRVIAALRSMAARLTDPSDTLARSLQSELQALTGLSRPMIAWGLRTSLQSLRDAPLEAMVNDLAPAPVPSELVGVVLAGNVFVAALRALCLPLLAGACVIAKAASRECAFPNAIKQALQDADEDVGARLSVLQFPREAQDATRALCQAVDALSIYGDDASVHNLSALTRPGCRVIAHGHGISTAYIARSQLMAAGDAQRAAAGLALDVAAYDQHGCLSPQFAYVEEGGAVTPQAFAELLAHEALPLLALQLPPAAPTLEERAARMQWQAAAAVRGEVHACAEHVVSFEETLRPRPSPGGRLLAVHSCSGLAELQENLAGLREHLKLIGVAGTPEDRAQLRGCMRNTPADVCAVGAMQTPSFDAKADGRGPFEGLVPTSSRA